MADDIQIQVNGESRRWRSGGTVAALLCDLDIKAERVAVELNLEILDRARFGEQPLREGDRVEILSFIGGGGISNRSRF
jgi:sulfur carrier protein